MISPISSTPSEQAVKPPAPRTPPPAPKNPPPQDSVHFSSKATGGGDADHDGDSH
jgi:hypothetical protein